MVLLKWVKSACGVAMWFESSRSPLYSNSLSLLSLSPHCFLSPSQIGAKAREHWHFFFSLRGCVTSSPPLHLIFLVLYFHFCVSILQENWGVGKGLESLVLLTWPFPLCDFFFLSLIKAVVCLCTRKAAEDKCQEDYFKLAKLNIGRNKHEMICTKTTISDARGVDVQYWRSSRRREKMWRDDF